MKRISKYWTLIETSGIAAALFNSRTHILFYNYYHRPDWAGLAVNSFVELTQDGFYDKLEKIQAK